LKPKSKTVYKLNSVNANTTFFEIGLCINPLTSLDTREIERGWDWIVNKQKA